MGSMVLLPGTRVVQRVLFRERGTVFGVVLIGILSQLQDVWGDSFTLMLLMSKSHQATIAIDKSSRRDINGHRALIIIVILQTINRRQASFSLTRLDVEACLTLSFQVRIQVGIGSVLTPYW